MRQSNKAKVITTCKLNAVSKSVESMKPTIDNRALLHVLNKAKGMSSSSTSDQKICNNIQADMSSCSWASKKQCCEIKNEVRQRNEIETCGHVNNTSQSNKEEIFGNCNLTSSSTLGTDVVSKIFNTASAGAVNSSVGVSLSFLFIGWVVLLALLVFVGYGFNTAYKSPTTRMVALGLLAAGSASVSLQQGLQYASSSEDGYDVRNRPLGMCSAADPNSEGTGVRMTYGAMLSEFEDDTGIQAFDFFADVSKSDDNNGGVPDELDLGTGFFYKSLNKTLFRSEKDQPGTAACQDHDGSVTKVKPTPRSTTLLVSSIASAVLCVTMVVLAIHYTRQAPSPSGVRKI